eukprot:3398664-Pyramimonas_sp.AAC.1
MRAHIGGPGGAPQASPGSPRRAPSVAGAVGASRVRTGIVAGAAAAPRIECPTCPERTHFPA